MTAWQPVLLANVNQPNSEKIKTYMGRGGYEALMDYEGEAYARWLNGSGYTCFVAQYRLTPHGYILPAIIPPFSHIAEPPQHPPRSVA